MIRQKLIDTVGAILRDRPEARAAWLGGSDASGRTDAWSDVDLLVVAEDDRVEDLFVVVEEGLSAWSPITDRYRLPPPTWHGHEQAFYRLERAGPHVLLDFVVIRQSNEERYLEPERHGRAVVLFDRDGIVAGAPPLDRSAHEARMEARRADLVARFPIFQSFVIKAIERGQPTDAMQFFRGMTLIPLVELLRIKHCPDRFDFGLRYLDRDLPPELKETIDRLSYAADMDVLRRHQAEAARLFDLHAAP